MTADRVAWPGRTTPPGQPPATGPAGPVVEPTRPGG